jgi:hypothetical protein
MQENYSGIKNIRLREGVEVDRGHDKERDQPPQKSIHRKSEDNTTDDGTPVQKPACF